MILGLDQTATIENYLGLKNGKPNYDEPIVVSCKIEHIRAVQLAGDMAGKISSTRMYTVPISPLPKNLSRVRNGEREYFIGQVGEIRAFGKVNHLEVMLI